MNANTTPCFQVVGYAPAAIYAARPWMVLAGVCAVLLASVDRVGPVIALGTGMILGLGDALWTLVKLRRHRILFFAEEIHFVSGRRKPTVFPIGPETAFVVQASKGGLVEWISAAYTTYTLMRMSFSGDEIELLAKSSKQVDRLRHALDDGLARARALAREARE